MMTMASSPWPDVETGNMICAVGLHSLRTAHDRLKIHSMTMTILLILIMTLVLIVIIIR